MDGWVIIGTDLNTKTFDKKLKNLETKLEGEEVNLEIKTRNLNKVKEDIMAIGNELREINAQRKQVSKIISDKERDYNNIQQKAFGGGSLAPNELLRMDRLQKELPPLKEQQQQLSKEAEKYNAQYEKLSDMVVKVKDQYDKQLTKVQNIKDEISRTNEEIKKNNLKEARDQLKNISKSTEHIVKKIARWGLAIFSIRSGYMLVRQAMSTLSQYNEKMRTDIEYIRWILANTLKPIVEYIMDLARKLITYVIYIGKAWGLISKEADFSANAFDKTKKSIGDTNKSAKELQKTLAGFDEMNILNKNGSTGSLGSSDFVEPSFDLGNIEDIKVPSWIDWIAKNGPYIVTILGAIGASLAAIKLTTFIGGLMGVTEGLSKFATGIGVLVSGLVLMGGSIARLIINWNDLTLSQKQASVELASLGGALVALGLVITDVVSGPVGALIAGISLLAGVIANIIIEQKEEEKTTMSVVEADKKLKKAKNDLVNATSKYTSAVKNVESASKDLLDIEKRNKITGQELYDAVVDGTLSYKNMTTAQREVFDAYIKNTEAQKKLDDITKEYTESMIAEKDAREQKSASIYAETQQYEGYFKTLLDGYNAGKISAKDMVEGTLAVMSKMDESTRTTFAQNLPQNVRDAFKQVREEVYNGKNIITSFENGVEISYRDIEDANKNLISDFGKTFATKIPNDIQKSIDKVKNLTNSLGSLAKNGAVNIVATVKSSAGSKNAKGAVYYPPKLATGGIINMPGRGVPLGAIGGERGAEGVIPLTDSQMMAQLGEAIGKNVVINTILNNYMNSRLISREQQKTSNIDKFAFNG